MLVDAKRVGAAKDAEQRDLLQCASAARRRLQLIVPNVAGGREYPEYSVRAPNESAPSM